MTVGALPNTPAGEGSVTGANDVGTATVVVVVGGVVVEVVLVDVVVVVGGVLFPVNTAAPMPMTMAAAITTMTPRRMPLRRFSWRC